MSQAGSFLQEDGHRAVVLSSSSQPFVCFCTTVPILGRGKGEATKGQLGFMDLLYCTGTFLISYHSYYANKWNDMQTVLCDLTAISPSPCTENVAEIKHIFTIGT